MRRVVRLAVPAVLGLLGACLCGGCAGPRCIKVSPGIYEGHKPWTEGDFNALRAEGIQTILSLELYPWDVWPERWQAHRGGFAYLDVPILASMLPPREPDVRQALLLLHDDSLRPIFIHCFLGRDRDTFIIGLYRIYFEGWTPEAAWEEMLRSGFHSSFRLRGLTTYFWHHTQVPDWAKRASSAREPGAPLARQGH